MIYSLNEVLIVAKCIVNYEDCNGGIDWYEVLIVAKCIVNLACLSEMILFILVLIVAKCIVNIVRNNILFTFLSY